MATVVAGLILFLGLAAVGVLFLFFGAILTSIYFGNLCGEGFESASKLIAWTSGAVGLVFGLLSESALVAILAIAFSAVVLGTWRAVWRRISSATSRGSAATERSIPPRTIRLPLPD
jgi:hypothetical protein